MTQKDKAEAVKVFINDPSVRIMLISLKYVQRSAVQYSMVQLFSLPITSHLISSLLVLSHLISCRPISSHLFSSYLILSCLVLSRPVLSCLVSYHFLIFSPLLFFPPISFTVRAGGVGLNLTSASVVILLDPWWNPSTEDQAIDRYVLYWTILKVRERWIDILCSSRAEQKKWKREGAMVTRG